MNRKIKVALLLSLLLGSTSVVVATTLIKPGQRISDNSTKVVESKSNIVVETQGQALYFLDDNIKSLNIGKTINFIDNVYGQRVNVYSDPYYAYGVS